MTAVAYQQMTSMTVFDGLSVLAMHQSPVNHSVNCREKLKANYYNNKTSTVRS